MPFDRFLLWNHANTYLARFSGTLTVVIGRHHFHPMVMNASLMTNNRHHCSISIVPFSCPNSTNQLRVISIQVQWTKENKSLTKRWTQPKADKPNQNSKQSQYFVNRNSKSFDLPEIYSIDRNIRQTLEIVYFSFRFFRRENSYKVFANLVELTLLLFYRQVAILDFFQPIHLHGDVSVCFTYIRSIGIHIYIHFWPMLLKCFTFVFRILCFTNFSNLPHQYHPSYSFKLALLNLTLSF